MSDVNKKQLTDLVAERAGISKVEAKRWVDVVLTEMANQLSQGNELRMLPDLGIFRIRESMERVGRNPKTGEPIHIGAKKNISFNATSSLKDTLNSI